MYQTNMDQAKTVMPVAKHRWLKCLFIFGGFMLALAVSSCKISKTESDNSKHHYAALYHQSKGNFKKAKRFIRKAIKRDPTSSILQKNLADIHFDNQRSDLALAVILDNLNIVNSEVNQAVDYAWAGVYALDKGSPGEGIEYLEKAIELVEKQPEAYPDFLSHLYCNRGIATLMDQSKNSSPKGVPDYKKIHREDFKQASEFMVHALKEQANNPVALKNLAILKAITRIEYEKLSYGYIPDRKGYDTLSIPKLDEIPQGFFRSTGIIPPGITGNDTLPANIQDFVQLAAKKEEIVILLDISGSMNSAAPNGKVTRFEMMKAATLFLLEWLDSDIEIGLISIGGDCITRPLVNYPVGAVPRNTLKEAVKKLRIYRSTPLNNRLEMSLDYFSNKPTKKALILFSDGLNSCPHDLNTCDLTIRFKDLDIQLYVFSMLLEASSNFAEYAVYNCLATQSEGELFGINQKNQIEQQTKSIENSYFSIPLLLSDFTEGFHTTDFSTRKKLSKALKNATAS